MVVSVSTKMSPAALKQLPLDSGIGLDRLGHQLILVRLSRSPEVLRGRGEERRFDAA